MSFYLCEIDNTTFNYPERVILLLSKDDTKHLKEELNGTATSIYEFNTIGCDLSVPSNVISSAEDITEKVLILKEALIQGRVCARCQSLLLPSSVDGYSFQCPHHDEDLFTIETIAGEYTPVKFQEFLLDFFYNSNLNNGKTIQELKKKV